MKANVHTQITVGQGYVVSFCKSIGWSLMNCRCSISLILPLGRNNILSRRNNILSLDKRD
jgi:hypothetical protein